MQHVFLLQHEVKFLSQRVFNDRDTVRANCVAMVRFSKLLGSN